MKAFYAVVKLEAPSESRIDCQNVSAYLFDLIEREYGPVSDVTVVKDPARCAACEALVESQFPGDVRLSQRPNSGRTLSGWASAKRKAAKRQ